MGSHHSVNLSRKSDAPHSDLISYRLDDDRQLKAASWSVGCLADWLAAAGRSIAATSRSAVADRLANDWPLVRHWVPRSRLLCKFRLRRCLMDSKLIGLHIDTQRISPASLRCIKRPLPRWGVICPGLPRGTGKSISGEEVIWTRQARMCARVRSCMSARV